MASGRSARDLEWCRAGRQHRQCKRLCRLGLGEKPALLWEDHQGNARRYTFDDLRVLTDTMAAFLRDEAGLHPGERICLFLDRVPELYFGFLAILKMGGIVQPLFSAFGDDSLWTRLDNAGTAAVITQRKICSAARAAPELRTVVVADAGDLPGPAVAPTERRSGGASLSPSIQTPRCSTTPGTTGQP